MWSTWSLDAALGELHTGPRHPLSGADPMWYNLNINQKGRVIAGTWRSITRLTPGGGGVRQPWSAAHLGEGTQIINSLVGETCQPWLATHLGDGNSYFKPIAKGIYWHCLS